MARISSYTTAGRGMIGYSCLGHKATLDRLRRQKSGGADGTFKVFPRLWLQVYTVHAAIGGYRIPCIYALLPDKSQETYIRMWREIRNLAGPGDDGQERLVTMDFERAAINAFLEKFPQSNVAGCFFHLGQSVYRKVKELGLSGNTRPARTSAFGRRPSPPYRPPPTRRGYRGV